MASPQFTSSKEFREVMDRVFGLMDSDPDMGPKLRDADVPQRFGRGGFVELALRTGSPIVPVAVVGSEEIYPKIAELPLLARLTGAPYFPVTPTFPLLGPLGAIPLPSRWRIAFDESMDLAALAPDAAEDRAEIFALAEEVRDRIQAKVFENLVEREGAFL